MTCSCAVLYTSMHHTSFHGNQLFPARQSDKGPEGAMETLGTVTEACWQVTATLSFAHMASRCAGQHPQQQSKMEIMRHARLMATICSAEVNADTGPTLWSLLMGGQEMSDFIYANNHFTSFLFLNTFFFFTFSAILHSNCWKWAQHLTSRSPSPQRAGKYHAGPNGHCVSCLLALFVSDAECKQHVYEGLSGHTHRQSKDSLTNKHAHNLWPTRDQRDIDMTQIMGLKSCLHNLINLQFPHNGGQCAVPRSYHVAPPRLATQTHLC